VHVMLYRVAQEALNNVARHAHAQNAWLVLDLAPSSVRLLVTDDGTGFEPAEVRAGHLGLISMRERAAEAGATLTVTSCAGEGTEVTAEWCGDAGSGTAEDDGTFGAAR
jgi:signal transduction histidine kinase